MANNMNLIKVGQAIRRRGLRLFSPLELQRILGISAIAARFLVHRYAKRGVFTKLRKGLYCLADQPPSELALANRLYEPSYLSFEFALSYYHLIPETTYMITSATSRPTRVLTALGKVFEYHRLKKSVFTGYEPVRVGVETILMATPEKALVDTLYFVDLKKKTLNDRLDLRTLNWRRAEFCVRLFGRPSLRELLRGLR
jgi:predicted transcriptional regulator of viral defense system